MSSRWARGDTSTSSTPATSAHGPGEAEHVVAHGGQRPDRQHAAPLGRDAVAGADLGVGRQRGDGHAGRAVGADRLDELEAGRAPAADALHEHLDAADVAGGEDRRADPAVDLDPRAGARARRAGRAPTATARAAPITNSSRTPNSRPTTTATTAATRTIQPWRVGRASSWPGSSASTAQRDVGTGTSARISPTASSGSSRAPRSVRSSRRWLSAGTAIALTSSGVA